LRPDRRRITRAALLGALIASALGILVLAAIEFEDRAEDGVGPRRGAAPATSDASTTRLVEPGSVERRGAALSPLLQADSRTGRGAVTTAGRKIEVAFVWRESGDAARGVSGVLRTFLNDGRAESVAFQADDEGKSRLQSGADAVGLVAIVGGKVCEGELVRTGEWIVALPHPFQVDGVVLDPTGTALPRAEVLHTESRMVERIPSDEYGRWSTDRAYAGASFVAVHPEFVQSRPYVAREGSAGIVEGIELVLRDGDAASR